MYIVAIGWMYVVLMMSIAEDTVVAGIMTFLLYGALPVGLILYIAGSRRRRERRAMEERKPPSQESDS
jgi:biotin transporter BioY